MKKSTFYYLVIFVFASAFLIISACVKEGPEGPAGPQGPTGPQGPQGEPGINGQDGTASCILCHDNSETIRSKSIQWEASVHATGGNFERNGTDCAPCHTSQGFKERIATGAQTTANVISDPTPPNCYTCHKIHTDYTTSDWDRTTTDAVTFWINDTSHDFGKGNICAQCHQARIPDPQPTATAAANDSVTITSPYWGIHHGPQGVMLAGTGGVEFTGSLTYTNSAHTAVVTDACVTCHMADAYGTQAGGHTMNMTYLYHGQEKLNDAACKTCHTDVSTDIDNVHAELDPIFQSLKVALAQRGVLDTTSMHPVPKKMKEIEAGAILNLLFFEEDRSEGVHNTDYAKALLQNSLEAVNALK